MTDICKLELDAETKTHADKFYNMIKYNLHHLATAFPESCKSCEIIEGDGENVGTVRLWKYVLPGTSEILVAKETLIEKDDAEMSITYSVTEGDLVKHYTRFIGKIHVNEKGDGSLVKWTLEYKKTEGAPDPHHYMDLYAKVIEKLDAHLIKA